MKKLILQPSSLILFTVLLIIIIIVAINIFPYAENFVFLHYARHQADAPPENNPANCLPKQDGQKRAVFLGDSITMGRVSVNFVDLLAEKLDAENIDLINAGINSQLAYNVLQRLDEVIACDPDFVFVLIGTNDLNAMALEGNEVGYMQGQKLPQKPSPQWYRENLAAIATTLKAETEADVYLLSLPPLGERIESDAYQLSAEYREIVAEVAAETAVSYLPLHESMTSYLEKQPGERRGYGEEWNELIVEGITQQFLYRQSLDTISKRNGFLILTDSVHLNSTGANMIVDLVYPYLSEE